MVVLHTDAWRRVPLGPDAAHWVTRPDCAQILLVADTVVSAQRLLDVARIFLGDPRVQVLATVPESGVFDNGVAGYLDNAGMLEVPWRQAAEHHFGLALAAGTEGLHDLHAPVALLPHGTGWGKRLPRPRGVRTTSAETYGLGPSSLVHGGSPLADVVVLAHREERARLARSCPSMLPRARVIGDPCYDRILASLPYRAAYREALGVQPSQRLVVVASTWRERSLLGQAPQVPAQLARQLTGDFKVAAMVHAAAWSAHGPWQVRAWYAEALACGAVLIDPSVDWCGVLAAGDIFVGDHGSMSLYATAAGLPVVLGCRPPMAEIDPDSPMAQLVRVAPRLNPERPLTKQVDRLTRDFRRGDYEAVAARITSRPGRFAVGMRRLAYQFLGLCPPSEMAPTVPAEIPVL